MKIIAVTGGFKMGKSRVCSMLRDLGADVISADTIAHRIMQPGTQAFNKVADEFGPGILDKAGRIDREKLASIVFSDEAKLKSLNAIVHPEVIRDLKEYAAELACEKPDAVLAAEIPLLYEAGIEGMADYVIAVSTSFKTQLKRALEATELNEAEIKKRIQSQLPINKKTEEADFVINNDASLKETEKQVKDVWKKIKE